MDERILDFIELNKIFEKNGFSLYLVGGTVRDYLLNLPLSDMDAVTDATPKEIEVFLPDACFTFAKYGSVSYKNKKGIKFDITTLREEKGYSDSRHPNKINFVKDLKIDVRRRDFTVNALYLDKELEVLDYVYGISDLRNHILKMVGEPKTRLEEDPLRIIRALRFSIDYDLVIEEQLEKAIKESVQLLDNLNPEKIKQDIKKIKCQDQDKINKLFSYYGINLL